MSSHFFFLSFVKGYTFEAGLLTGGFRDFLFTFHFYLRRALHTVYGTVFLLLLYVQKYVYTATRDRQHMEIGNVIDINLNSFEGLKGQCHEECVK